MEKKWGTRSIKCKSSTEEVEYSDLEARQTLFHLPIDLVEYQWELRCLKENEKSWYCKYTYPMPLKKWFPSFDCEFGVPQEIDNNSRIQGLNGKQFHNARFNRASSINLTDFSLVIMMFYSISHSLFIITWLSIKLPEIGYNLHHWFLSLLIF